MLNWPRMGNDWYFNAINLNRNERLKGYNEAKQATMRFIYHIQTTLGFKYLGLADDEFPTPDSLALMPYHREARRLRGRVRMTINHVLKPYSDNLYRTACAVGDYPVDHHHAKYPHQNDLPHIEFPSVPSFSIPLGSLIPAEKQGVENLIAAEKCISVSNIINGSTRLQPCVLLIGQAAGTLAALSVKSGTTPARVPVRSVQQSLLDAKCWLLPFLDVPPENPLFQTIQKIGLTGALRGTGISYKWANQTWFYPDSTLSYEEFRTALFAVLPTKAAQKLVPDVFPANKSIITLGDAVAMLRVVKREVVRGEQNEIWAMADGDKPLTRSNCALLLHKAFNPFDRVRIDLQGNSIPQHR
jgi:hypothetical protein